jgi:hypothetical protein
VIAEKKSPKELAENPKTPLDGPGPATKEEKANDKKLINSRGPTADYLAARIARDRPDILKRMKEKFRVDAELNYCHWQQFSPVRVRLSERSDNSI